MFDGKEVLELGVAGVALMVVWKVLDVARNMYLNAKLANSVTTVKEQSVPTMTPLACQVDPTHFQRIKDIHEYTEGVQKQIAEGQFACAWKDRDEVRDLLEAIRELTTGIRKLTKTMNGHPHD